MGGFRYYGRNVFVRLSRIANILPAAGVQLS